MKCITASARIAREADCSAVIEREWSALAEIERDVATEAVIIRDVVCMAMLNRNFECRASIICSINLEDDSLWASDQVLLTIDGGRIYVTRAI